MSLIITLTGMSTSGKSTLAKALSSHDEFSEAVSLTTRSKRPGEVSGKDYFFVDDDTFAKYVESGLMLEYVSSHHASYGVPAFEIDRIMEEGRSPVLVLEPAGVKSMHRVAMERGIHFMSLFIKADMEVLMQRFIDRIGVQIASGHVVDYTKEAGRLHTMMTVERQWEGLWPWSDNLTNLHEECALEHQIERLKSIHAQSGDFKPKPSTLALPLQAREIPLVEIARLIESAIDKRLGAKPLLNLVVSRFESNHMLHADDGLKPY